MPCGVQVVGVDKSEFNADVSQRRHQNISFYNLDAFDVSAVLALNKPFTVIFVDISGSQNVGETRMPAACPSFWPGREQQCACMHGRVPLRMPPRAWGEVGRIVWSVRPLGSSGNWPKVQAAHP